MKRNKIEGDIREFLDVEKLMTDQYRFAFVQRVGSVYIGLIEGCGILNPDEILEARFFEEEKEMHVFKYDEKLEAVVTEYEDGDEYIEERQLLRGKYGEFLILRFYLFFDENDGQARIGHTVFKYYERGGGISE